MRTYYVMIIAFICMITMMVWPVVSSLTTAAHTMGK